MGDYISTTDRAALIRAALKAKGWNSRKVSVRAEYYSMGSSIHVVVKDITVPLDVVKAIATEHERIDRCEVSGEILAGCNRYVHVSYSREATKAAAAPLVPAVEAAIAKVHDNYLIPIDGVPFLVGRQNAWTLQLWNASDDVGGFVCQCSNAQDMAEVIARRMHAKAAA